MVDWSYFDKFDEVSEKYLPASGEGENMATQIVTAVSKLVYKWYNDGDVFDNTYRLEGWCNDLSSYANWLAKYVKGAGPILKGIADCSTHGEYEGLLKDLADTMLDADFLAVYENVEKVGSIYKCEGPFRFEEYEEEEEDWEEDEEEDW